MGLKSFLAKPYARYMRKQIDKWANAPLEYQNQVFERLIQGAKNTAFGKDHNFDKINSYEDFKREVAVSDYEGLRPYVDRMVKGEENVLWKGKPLYFAKTSGTTSGAKYIPISKESMPTHIDGTKNATLIQGPPDEDGLRACAVHIPDHMENRWEAIKKTAEALPGSRGWGTVLCLWSDSSPVCVGRDLCSVLLGRAGLVSLYIYIF